MHAKQTDYKLDFFLIGHEHAHTKNLKVHSTRQYMNKYFTHFRQKKSKRKRRIWIHTQVKHEGMDGCVKYNYLLGCKVQAQPRPFWLLVGLTWNVWRKETQQASYLAPKSKHPAQSSISFFRYLCIQLLHNNGELLRRPLFISDSFFFRKNKVLSFFFFAFACST